MWQRDYRRWMKQERKPWPVWVRVLVLIGLLMACGLAYHNFMLT